MYYLYILKCADETLYTGISADLERRMKEHNSGKRGAKYTRARRPVRLVYSKKFRPLAVSSGQPNCNRSLASKAEARIKNLSRTEKLELIKNYHSA